MNIYIVRHGETNYNVERRYQGMFGVSHLTEKGEAQAVAARALLDGVDFEKIYVSSSARTRETAKLLFPERDDFIFSDDLREVDVGELTNRLSADCRAEMPEKYEIADADGGFDIFGGESKENIFTRAKKEAAKILQNGGETIAVVSHGGIIRYLLAAFLEVSPDLFGIFENCAVTHISITQKARKICFSNRIAMPTAEPNTAH